MKTDCNHRLRLSAVTVLLFLSHWVYYKVTFGVLTSNWNVLLDLLYPAVFYLALFLALPPAVPVLWMAFGCGGLCVSHGLLADSTETEFFFPFLILPALVFCLLQEFEKRKNKQGVSAFLSVLLQFCPLLIAVLFVVLLCLGKLHPAVSSRGMFALACLVILFGLFLLISFLPQEKNGTRKQKTGRRSKTPFLPAAAILLETAAFAVCFPSVTLTNTVPLVWTVNLLFLYHSGEPSVCAFVSRVRKKEDAFLNEET